nr:hypothetical protein [Anaerolineae bacterium]
MAELPVKGSPSVTPFPVPEDIGLVRRIWQGRIWYGTEWYLAVTGALILILMIIMTILARVLAPYDPNEFVAGPFTPPGRGQQALLARAGESPVQAGDNLAGLTVGATRNSNGIKVA